MGKTVVKRWTGDGGAVYIPIGFKADYVKMVEFYTDTNIKMYEWFGLMDSIEVSGKQEGFSIVEGVTANLADAGGLQWYDSSAQAPTISDWSAASSPTARSAGVIGTLVRPTTSSSMDRDAIFECVTAGTGGATEPTWPKGIGEQVLDGTNLWERVNEPRLRKGYQGVYVPAALQTDGYSYYMLAMQADENADEGDVVGWSGGVKG